MYYIAISASYIIHLKRQHVFWHDIYLNIKCVDKDNIYNMYLNTYQNNLSSLHILRANCIFIPMLSQSKCIVTCRMNYTLYDILLFTTAMCI